MTAPMADAMGVRGAPGAERTSQAETAAGHGSRTFDAPRIGTLPAGPLGTIADVAGVTVGHHTRDAGGIQTGVTVIRPHPGDPFRAKVPAAAAVINGFGKSLGLLQLDELGLIETPIALTNTFAIGALAEAQTRHACERNPEIGRSWPTVNPLVFECNDGYLNDLQAMAVRGADYRLAHDAAAPTFAQGSVGAGRGMSCFDLKGGIGSASRQVAIDGERFVVGAFVLANFGRLPMLTVGGAPLGRQLAARLAAAAPVTAASTPASSTSTSASDPAEKGSIIMVIATDAPLDNRQLRRIAARAAAGLARTGSVYGHGSGDIALAFSTAYTVSHAPPTRHALPALIHPAALDPFFIATAEAVEQAIVHALWSARSVTGRDGHRRQALTELAPDWRELL
ncbi:P1 family peptidase [Robbsia sp. Bb-Pol-6]|uniref:P1 family peptidase n=1 Tax=Robbsia betulipollinis TaxID=2981849 RepID=A0ABT3ZH45_9BURK|nr:P1 family peptidase [Robbsia betulipollinis]MCY0385849.1 P1 family peptidase [Robbsia betulipollinis]